MVSELENSSDMADVALLVLASILKKWPSILQNSLEFLLQIIIDSFSNQLNDNLFASSLTFSSALLPFITSFGCSDFFDFVIDVIPRFLTSQNETISIDAWGFLSALIEGLPLKIETLSLMASQSLGEITKENDIDLIGNVCYVFYLIAQKIEIDHDTIQHLIELVSSKIVDIQKDDTDNIQNIGMFLGLFLQNDSFKYDDRISTFISNHFQ
uniref:Uncharacterized protein n=1 Tax=Coptotermes formosanus TaxID=36987 RepID=R4UXE2_COPFO|nr:hypothetical protein [Coptotermes formosanus]